MAKSVVRTETSQSTESTPEESRGLKTKNLTLYTETQLLLLVGDVAADCSHQRHGDGTDDPRDGAHLGRCLCERASSRGVTGA